MSNAVAQRQDSAAVVPAGESATILQVIQRAAADPQCDIEKMERLMAMHERMQARNAEAEFNASMAAMQSEMPSIAERGQIKVQGQVRSNYATFEDINDIVKPIMQQFGFAVSFRVETVQAGMSVTGILMHRAGHREQTTMLLPLDTSGSKNAVQALGSSVSYGKRYVLCALLNITTRGEDDDGNAAVPPKKLVTPAQAQQLHALLAQCLQDTQDAFDGMYGATENVPAAEFDATLARLTKARERAKRATQE
ncbi:ERF family protein [Metapseudomonas furukawaii]|uniref:ERF family protein n=1 Tax=Metapseudomonas furukawaii TaxID=1149133 RepID=UPI00227A308B|nr:ERF family protein [Pseudomonas furukawaii]WAG77013.1 ERF family protein [Pseudomonas furukawaii]